MATGKTKIFPVLPLRDIVVFPQMIVPLFVGREKSVRALEKVMSDSGPILLVTQLDPTDDDPLPSQIYRTGVLASVLQLLKLPDGTVKVLVEGNQRARIARMADNGAHLVADVEPVPEDALEREAAEAVVRAVKSKFETYVEGAKKAPKEAK